MSNSMLCLFPFLLKSELSKLFFNEIHIYLYFLSNRLIIKREILLIKSILMFWLHFKYLIYFFITIWHILKTLDSNWITPTSIILASIVDGRPVERSAGRVGVEAAVCSEGCVPLESHSSWALPHLRKLLPTVRARFGPGSVMFGWHSAVWFTSDRCRATHLELPKTRGTGPESRPL